MGFVYKRIDRRARVMMSSRILVLRDKYLYKMQQMRAEGRPIIFLDETWYDSHDVVGKGNLSSLDTPTSRGKRKIILHAGCEKGWVPGALLIAAKNIKDASADYHQDMNSDLFETWFENKLIPGLNALFPERKCVIVLDNASYHSRLLHKTPSMNMRRDDIIKTLQRLGITVPTCVIGTNNKRRIPKKADLIQVYKDAGIEKEYCVNKLAEVYGHEVVRFPPYYCIYNPIEMVWSKLKRNVRRRNTSPALSVRVINHIRDVVADITENFWSKCCKHCREEETNSRAGPMVEPFIISLLAQ